MAHLKIPVAVAADWSFHRLLPRKGTETLRAIQQAIATYLIATNYIRFV
ncbi:MULTISPECIES: hypothetical protein [Nostoc]|uniref:Uncharacterized protein n=1 Tax=Nostoc paludosum FACHB-159 TaxID=2692908 RepID=A0ABR8K5Y8_9NOSO|nr:MULTISPECIES: hypothetical protein [Nostoc]MBD2677361.1 hypothetical protein [Nostoc sp. FACHB-857]MBD2734246.1 hypothetical protein [Nostoc paludosum FACHB-159]